MGDVFSAIALFAVSALALVIGILQFNERGFLMNNAYLYASPEEREKMNKKPYYRQSAVIFFILTAVFFITGLSVLVPAVKSEYIAIPLCGAALVYAIVSSVIIRSKERKKREEQENGNAR